MPLEVLEAMTVSEAALPKALRGLVDPGNLSEVVVLSTCARTEVYAVAERFHGGLADVHGFLADLAPSRPPDWRDRLYCHFDDDAVGHLFEVSAGLDSAVLGEGEILAQVRWAWERAREERTAGSVLSELFRRATEVGKRARSETDIARGTTSVSQAAVALAKERLGGSLDGRRVLVLGAGEMGEGMAQALGAARAEVLVANRTWSRAAALADRVGGRPVEMAAVVGALAEVDVLLCSTGAPGTVVEADDLAPVMAARPDRPLFVVDLAVPRDVDPGVAGVPGVRLADMTELSAFARAGMAARRAEVTRVRVILAEEVRRYQEARAARTAAPMVAALRERAEAIRQAELERHGGRLARLDPKDREAVETLTRQLLNKLLHEPTMALKEAGGTPRADRLGEALRTLFDL
ncbi:MAG TPA: glutamyl-tRNA reductase [Acidimicrobiales bacterium]|nr:glutamyl-tRNA reductase [Acidimicrobiales bacterium]